MTGLRAALTATALAWSVAAAAAWMPLGRMADGTQVYVDPQSARPGGRGIVSVTAKYAAPAPRPDGTAYLLFTMDVACTLRFIRSHDARAYNAAGKLLREENGDGEDTPVAPGTPGARLWSMLCRGALAPAMP